MFSVRTVEKRGDDRCRHTALRTVVAPGRSFASYAAGSHICPLECRTISVAGVVISTSSSSLSVAEKGPLGRYHFVYHTGDGRISSCWTVSDSIGLMQQLSLTPQQETAHDEDVLAAFAPRSRNFMRRCKKMMDTVRVPSIPGWLAPIASIDLPLARGPGLGTQPTCRAMVNVAAAARAVAARTWFHAVQPERWWVQWLSASALCGSTLASASLRGTW